MLNKMIHSQTELPVCTVGLSVSSAPMTLDNQSTAYLQHIFCMYVQTFFYKYTQQPLMYTVLILYEHLFHITEITQQYVMCCNWICWYFKYVLPIYYNVFVSVYNVNSM